jgi:predicted permease
LGIVAIVLVAACANLAGLLLARGASRQHELSVRSALGAGRWRLARQSLTESLLISLIGAGLGLALATWGKTILSRLLWPSGITVDLRSDLFVLGFTLIVSLGAALLFGLVPAWRSTRAHPMASLKERSALGTTRLRMGRVFVSMQVTLSMLLLVGAGLFTRTLINLRHIDAGFNTENLLAFNLDASKAGYEGKRRVDFYEQVRRSIAALPGVTAVTNSNNPLLGGRINSRGMAIPGSPSEEKITILELEVGHGFCSAMGIDLLAGRDFRTADNETSVKVIIVNNALAEKTFPGENSVGRLLPIGRTDYQIVGVCEDIKYENIKKSAEPTVFYPYLQRPDEVYAVYFEVRTAMSPLTLVPALRKALAVIDRNIPMADIRTQKIRIDESISQERLFASLSTALALLAVLLSCIGLFGLMAYNIAQRTGEIGIRKALGAAPRDVAWPVLRETFILAAAGVVVGIPVALALVRIIRGYLFGVSPYDPAALLGAAVLLVSVALLAAWIPARRAAKIDPMVALRYE